MEKRHKTVNTAPKWARILIPLVLITAWIGAMGVGGPYFGRIDEVSEVDLTAFLPKSAEATRVNEESKKFRSEKLLPAVIVYEAQGDQLAPGTEQAINALSKKLANIDGIEGVLSPAIISEDKKAALVTVPINSGAEISEVVKETRATIADAYISQTKGYVTGPAGFAGDLNVAFSGIDGVLLLVALAVVFVILIIVYRSPVLPILVLITSLSALSASIAIVWNLANVGLVELNGQVQGILFILVIGAATDYSLLYVSRYREELYVHGNKLASTLAAWKGSVEPILASGGTVIVGLLCLLLSDLASNKALGPVGAIGVGMSVIAALTFLPAMLYTVGRVSFWPIVPHADNVARKAHRIKLENGFWHRVGVWVAARPRPIWIVTVVVLLVSAFGMTQLRADGVAQSDLILGKSEARDGQAVVDAHFPGGSGSPALVVVDAAKSAQVVATLESDRGVDSVSTVASDSPSGLKPLGRAEAEIKNTIESSIEASIASSGMPAVPGAPTVQQLVDKAYPFANAKAKVVEGRELLQVTLTDTPDSQAAKDSIVRLRQSLRVVDSSVLVGGTTAVQYDTNQASIRDRAIIIPTVLFAITVILMVLLRSVLAPILLLLTTVISFGASLGIAAFLFNNVWGFPGADPSVVLYAFVFLVALGIDYNIFLMTRVREESLKLGTQAGVIKGLVVTGGVITSAGIVLAATFAALAVIPIMFLAQLAFVVAFGVLLDTVIVRSLLVPALIRDIGSIVWWPSKLRHKE